jgi:hypothetical protein
MSIVNRIVTRGFGMSRGLPGRAGPVTQGYGGPPGFVVAAIRRGFRVGQSGTKRRLREMQEAIVWAKLVELNGSTPRQKIEGFVRVKIDKNRGFASVMAEHVVTRVRKAIQDVKITVKRIK